MLNSSKQMMKYQFNLNEQAASINRNWQERMANSAHQREIADLKASGLNPVLSVTGGSGANTPSGSTASVSDGAGYFSALANLEAARLNSATQMFMHTTPGANTAFGQISYVADLLGIPLADLFGAFGDRTGLSDSSKDPLERLFGSNMLSFGPVFDSYNSGKSLKSFKSKDVEDYFRNIYGRFIKHSQDFVDDKISSSQYKYRTKQDSNLDKILASLYPEEWKKVYGSYPYKGLENNRRLKHANRKKKWKR